MTDQKTPEQIAADKQAEKDRKKAEAAAKKQAAADKKAADKRAKEDAKAAEKAASKQPKQNDITQPKAETLCGKVWGACDAVSAETGQPATIKAVMERLKGTVVAEATIRTQYARWRKFHGVVGRVAAPAPAPAPAGSPPPAA